jgi:two-component system, OmpR family, phosphate regulon response regulator OmpR
MDAGRRATHASGSHLLVVDDDEETRELLSLYLGQQGFDVAVVEDGEAMDAWLADNSTDLVILDLMLPGEDGLSIARRLRSEHKLPIVMISARGEELDRIVGLEVGADDYLPKPFNPRELLARIRAVLRRSAPYKQSDTTEDTSLAFGEFRFDGERRALYRNDREVELSRAEFDLLQVLVERPNRVLSRDLIMDCLSGGGRDPFDRSIDVRVARLRHKIEDDPSDPKLIRTVWGVGYQFTPKGDSP